MSNPYAPGGQPGQPGQWGPPGQGPGGPFNPGSAGAPQGPAGGPQGPGAFGPGPYGGGPQGPGSHGPGPQGPGPAGPPPGYGAPQPGQWGGQQGAPSAPSKPLDLGKILPLAVAGLALLNVIFGFLPVASFGPSGWITFSGFVALLFAGGLAAAVGLLPKKIDLEAVAGVLSAAGGLGMLFAFFEVGGGAGIGTILLLIFGLIQAIAGIVLLLVKGGIISAPATAGAASHSPAGPVGHQPSPAPSGFAPQGPTSSAPQPSYGAPEAQGSAAQGSAPYGAPDHQQGPPSYGSPDSYGPPSGGFPTSPSTGGHHAPDLSKPAPSYGRPDDGQAPPDATQQVRF